MSEMQQDGSVVARLAALKEEAGQDIKDARNRFEQAKHTVDATRSALEGACVVAMDAGLSAEDVAQLAGVSASTVRSFRPHKPRAKKPAVPKAVEAVAEVAQA